MNKPYDYRNCSSLFGYSAAAHTRSGGICQLCGAGGDEIDFDFWRQLTVEHLVGESQGGYRAKIQEAVADRFPEMSVQERSEFAGRIDAANTVTACSFCNATTSRTRHHQSMQELIAAPGSPEEVFNAVTVVLAEILVSKRATVAWKLESVRVAFDADVAPNLAVAREAR
jgi:hypothetical protein